eukprot:s954_g5.t1
MESLRQGSEKVILNTAGDPGLAAWAQRAQESMEAISEVPSTPLALEDVEGADNESATGLEPDTAPDGGF